MEERLKSDTTPFENDVILYGGVAMNSISNGTDMQNNLTKEQQQKITDISNREKISYNKALEKYKRNTTELQTYGISADYDLTNNIAPINPERQIIQVVETGNKYSNNTTLLAAKSGINNTKANRETVLFASKIAQGQQINITLQSYQLDKMARLLMDIMTLKQIVLLSMLIHLTLIDLH